jgi:hypothetical protein
VNWLNGDSMGGFGDTHSLQVFPAGTGAFWGNTLYIAAVGNPVMVRLWFRRRPVQHRGNVAVADAVWLGRIESFGLGLRCQRRCHRVGLETDK